MRQIRRVLALLLRGADADEVDVGECCRVLVGGGEGETTGPEVPAEDLGQARLVERHLACFELRNLAGIDVDSEHVVPEFGHAGRVRGSQIPCSEHCAAHTRLTTQWM